MSDTKYIVNTTYIISPYMHGGWYKFMVEKFIPTIEADSNFGTVRFTRLLSSEEEKHFTYSLQIDCSELYGYHHYTKSVMSDYNEHASQMFDTEITHFISLLKVIL